MRIGVDLGGTKIEGIAIADDGTIGTISGVPQPYAVQPGARP